MTTNSEYYTIQFEVLKNKDYSKALELLKKSDNFFSDKFQELYADILFAQNNFAQSAAIYEKLGQFYKFGYCTLLFGDRQNAQLIWENCPKSAAQNWGIFFCQLFTDKVTVLPTYLQIRAFLERDLGAFLKLNHIEFVQKIIDISEYLADINPETNKIIARCFLYNNYPTYAKEFFKRAFDFTTEDAELYYLSGLYYIKMNDLSEAKKCLRNAIKLNENYFPAKELLSELC